MSLSKPHSEKTTTLLAEPSLPRDPTILQRVAWNEMQLRLSKLPVHLHSTWQEVKVRNALSGYAIHIETQEDGPAQKIAENINNYISAEIRNGGIPFEKQQQQLISEAIDNSWNDFIRDEFIKSLHFENTEIEKILPEDETVVTIAQYSDEVDCAVKDLFTRHVGTMCAPEDPDFLSFLSQKAAECPDHEVEIISDLMAQACRKLEAPPSLSNKIPSKESNGGA